MITAVALALPLREQMRDEALRAYPRECCGLVEGFAEATLSRVVALHPMPNLATDADRFEVDPAAHIALLRKLRGTERDIIGCYHSHPNGPAEPSEHDCECAFDPGFLWLICTANRGAPQIRIAAFESTGRRLSPVRIAPA